MTYDQAVALWPWALGAFALTCLAVGYWAGVKRAYYKSGRSADLSDVLSSLLPYAGSKRNRQYRI